MRIEVAVPDAARRGGRAAALRRFVRRRRTDLFGLGSVIGLVIAYLSPSLKDGGSFGTFDLVLPLTSLGQGLYPQPPYNNTNSDVISEMSAWNGFDWNQIHAGHFPLWNDLTLLGLPQFLNFQSAVLSLPDLASYAAPLHYAFLVAVAMKLLIAGTGAYLLARVIGLRPLGATFAGWTYMLSGAFANWVSWPLDDVLCWLGWIIALSILAYRWRDRLRYVALLALALAFSIYGGFPEGYVMVAVALAGIVVVLVVGCLVARVGVSLRGVARVAGGMVAGIALSSPLWFPGLQVIDISHRATSAGYPTLPLRAAVLMFAPGYYGLPLSSSHNYLVGSNFYESVAYIGVVVALLAAVALVRWWRSPMVLALAVLCLAILLITYGGPVHQLINDTPAKAVNLGRIRSILGLPAGILGGLGLETLVRQGRERRVVSVFAGGTALFVLAMAGLWLHVLGQGSDPTLQSLLERSLIWPTVMAVICVAVTAALFVSRGGTAQPGDTAAAVAGVAQPVETQGERAGASGAGASAVGAVTGIGEWARTLRSRRGLLPLSGAVLLLLNGSFLLFAGVGLNSYSHTYYPTSPAIAELQRDVGANVVGLDDGNPQVVQPTSVIGFYPEANIPYGIDEFNGHDPVMPQQYFATFGKNQGVGGPSIIIPLINSAAIARTYGISYILVAKHLPPPTGTRFVADVAGERLYSVPGASRFSFLGSAGTVTAGDRVLSSSHPTSGDYEVVVDAAASGTLVLRVSDIPGWRATIDGRAVPISSYGGVMMSITVPAGHHVIALSYFPQRLTVALYLVAATVLVFAGLGVSQLGRRRRGRREELSYDLGLAEAISLARATTSGR